MSYLNTRGGANYRNRILSPAAANSTCAFGVSASRDGSGWYATVADGLVNTTSFHASNSGLTQVYFNPDTELALMLKFTSDVYETTINEIYPVEVPLYDTLNYRTLVDDWGDKFHVTMYVPIAYITLNPDGESVTILQYICSNINFRMYFTVLNAVPCVEFFNVYGITPGEVPISQLSE